MWQKYIYILLSSPINCLATSHTSVLMPFRCLDAQVGNRWINQHFFDAAPIWSLFFPINTKLYISPTWCEYMWLRLSWLSLLWFFFFLQVPFLVCFPQAPDQSAQSILLGANPQPSPEDSADTQNHLGPSDLWPLTSWSAHKVTKPLRL